MLRFTMLRFLAPPPFLRVARSGHCKLEHGAGRIVCGRGSSLKGRITSQPKRGAEDGWLMQNAGVVRNMPLFVGVASFVAILLNRALSGIAAIADASSAQSRADVLVVALSATVVLTGLVWKSIEPRPQYPVKLDGIMCMRLAQCLSVEAKKELEWVWEALSEATSAVSLVVVYGNTCIIQAGLAAKSSEPGIAVSVRAIDLSQGSLYKAVTTSRKQTYLANLSLYPDRSQLPFLPSNTQAVIVQPLGDDGVMVVGSDTLRGFGPSDQVWIVAMGEKLDSTLADIVLETL